MALMYDIQHPLFAFLPITLFARLLGQFQLNEILYNRNQPPALTVSKQGCYIEFVVQICKKTILTHGNTCLAKLNTLSQNKYFR